MNSKELTSEIKKQLQIDPSKVDALFAAFAQNIGNELCNGNSVAAVGFGVFEARRKKERIFVDPVSKDRVMSPPKQTLAFKMSTVLKDKINQENNQ